MLTIHAPDGKLGKVIKHDCSDFPDDPKYAIFKASNPYIFRDGDVVDLPEKTADYFLRAGWAAKEGEQPIKPDRSKPVLVEPDNGTLGTRSL